MLFLCRSAQTIYDWRGLVGVAASRRAILYHHFRMQAMDVVVGYNSACMRSVAQLPRDVVDIGYFLMLRMLGSSSFGSLLEAVRLFEGVGVLVSAACLSTLRLLCL